MIFYIHGLHKLEAGVEYLRDGKPGKLLEEVAGMHPPAPVASAWAATIIQLVCSLFIVAGLFTHLNAVLLTGALSGAIPQNVLAGRDPQLAILYTLVVVTIAFMGGGRTSLDAVLNRRCGYVGGGHSMNSESSLKPAQAALGCRSLLSETDSERRRLVFGVN